VTAAATRSLHWSGRRHRHAPRLASCWTHPGHGHRISNAHHEEVGEHMASPASISGSTGPRPRGRCQQAPTSPKYDIVETPKPVSPDKHPTTPNPSNHCPYPTYPDCHIPKYTTITHKATTPTLDTCTQTSANTPLPPPTHSYMHSRLYAGGGPTAPNNKKKRTMTTHPSPGGNHTASSLSALLDTCTNIEFSSVINKLPENWRTKNPKGDTLTKTLIQRCTWGAHKDDQSV